jgi:YVTN family beta-propeller protein
MLALGLVAALLAIGGVVYLLAQPTAPATMPLETVVQLDVNSGHVIGAVSTDTRGSGMTVGSGSLWEISYSDGTLLQIDPSTRAVTGQYGVPGDAPPVGVAAGPDAVWVTTAYGDESLRRFDPKTHQWQPPISLSSGLEGVAYGANAVWVADKADNLVWRVEPTTDSVTARIPVGEGPEGITVGAGGVWVANTVGRTVSRIDPASATVRTTIDLGSSPSAIAAGEDAVWVVSEGASRLTRIDPLTNAEVDVPFGIGPSAVTAFGRAVWVAEGVSGRVSRVDPNSLKAVASVTVPGAVDGVAAGGRSVWVTSHVLANPVPPESAIPHGGTLRIAVPIWDPSELANPAAQADALDPQIGGGSLDSNEILRCCLVRTLVSHVGNSYGDGGADLRPDLALKLPEVSADGLTWTFHIRPGLFFAPPMQRTEITSSDFVRSLQRDARLARSTTYSVIEGFDAYATDSGSPKISGLETPDRYTLQVHLNQAAGDLPYRFALPESAPIPPSPTDPAAQFGAASGHDGGYGLFLVASGPYMIDGSPRLDFSRLAAQQQPASGFQPGQKLTLVRNPSWRQATDPLRPAYVDQMELTMGLSDDDAAVLVDSGQADLILHGSPPPQVQPWLVEKFSANPRLGTVHYNQRDYQRAVEMNLAVPPFDDIHVRRAVNYILNKRALLEAHGGDLTGTVMTHYIVDSLEGGALSSYRPYATPEDRGSLELAMNEMSQSRYDLAHTGTCSAPVCKRVLAVTIPIGQAPFARLYGGFPHLGEVIAGELSQIGITLDVQSSRDMSAMSGNPLARIPLDLTLGLGANWPSASSSFTFDFTSDAVGGSLVGASPEQLRDWGYTVSSVPNIDSRINECRHSRERQTQCWTALDVYTMEKLVPVAPYVTEKVIDVVPSRVVHYSFDQSMDEVALDQIAVKD